MKSENKKGELTTQQIVIIIVLITSFAIILFFIFRLDLGKVTNKEICHNSVIMKSKSSLVGSLDCKTTYVCISGGENCEGFYDVKKEVDLRNENEARNKIMEIIADEMADCWWMFGEGKVDYIGFNIGVSIVGNKACAICSKIKFSEEIKNKGLNKISYEDFYADYLSKKKIESKTYLKYLYDANRTTINDLFNKEYLNNEINFNSEYVILTGIAKKGVLGILKKWHSENVENLKNFFGLENIATEEKSKDYLFIPITLIKQEDIQDFKCGEFLTKA
jgi:hypothetical protein